MDDKQPPKKKSRFFSNGRSTLGSVLQPSKTTLEATATPSAQPETSLRLRDPRNPSSSAIRANAPNTFAVVPIRTLAHNSGQELPPWGIQEENDTLQSPTNPSSAATALQGLSVRDRRRDGIYGPQALFPPGTMSLRQVYDVNRPPPRRFGNSTPSPVSQSAQANTQAPTSQFTFRAGQIPQVNCLPAMRRCQPPASHLPGRLCSATHVQPAGIPVPAQQPQPFMTHQDSGPLGASSQPFFDASQRLRSRPNGPLHGQPFLPRPAPAGVDLDRDAAGRRLQTPRPPPIANLPGRGITNLPFHATIHPCRRQTVATVPANLYTSPDRIAHATSAARSALKRKRPTPILPPPAYIYTRTNSHSFNIFHGILLYPELVFALASQLPVDDLVSLYAISRDFHTILDTRFTTVMLSQSLAKAPQSSRTFPFRCYAHLCRNDPAARIPHPDPRLTSSETPRRIPSIRWLRMILHREKTVHEIMTLFAEAGIPLPSRCALALKRLWFLLDIPDNSRRIGYVHQRRLFSDLDLYFAMCVFVKMDMYFNDPVGPEKRDGLRKMLLSQMTLSVWRDVLSRQRWRKRGDVLREWVRWKYELRDETEGADDVPTVFGVRRKWVGKLKLEYWGFRDTLENGQPVRFLLRPDQLVMREAVRRGLRFTRHFLRCLLYGYVRPDTLENWAPRSYGRRIEELKDDEYGVDDLVGGVAALAVEDGGDELLDLGRPRLGSVLTIKKEEVGIQEKEMRQRLDVFVEECMKWSERERQGERRSRKNDGLVD